MMLFCFEVIVIYVSFELSDDGIMMSEWRIKCRDSKLQYVEYYNIDIE